MIFRPDMLLFGDAAGPIITLIIIVISIIASVLQQMAEAKKRKGPVGRRPPRGRPPAQDDLQREIDAFLKGAGKKAEEPRGRRVPQPVPAEAVEPVIVAEPVEQSLADHVRQTMGELGGTGAAVTPAATSERGRRASGDRAEQRRAGRTSRSVPPQRRTAAAADARSASAGPAAPSAATASRVVRASEYPLS
ncbi:MAG: hypothetical protein GYA33_03540, partial [Thermogutta sp.]|nr:hypothetical protein [Thermogutta sp.]